MLRMIFLVLALSSPAHVYAQQNPEPWDGKPAETFLSCNSIRTLCIQRVVQRIEPGYYTFVNAPTCMNKIEDIKILEAAGRLVANKSDVGAENTLRNAGVQVARNWRLGGMIGSWLNSQSDHPDATATCVAIMAYVPTGVTDISYSAAVYDELSGKPGDLGLNALVVPISMQSNARRLDGSAGTLSRKKKSISCTA